MQIKLTHRIVQLFLKLSDPVVELVERFLADQTDAAFWKRQRDASPVVQRLRPDRRDGFERRVRSVEQLLAGRQELALGTERVSRLILLLRTERLTNAQPSKAKPSRRHRRPKPFAMHSGQFGLRLLQKC